MPGGIFNLFNYNCFHIYLRPFLSPKTVKASKDCNQANL